MKSWFYQKIELLWLLPIVLVLCLLMAFIPDDEEGDY